MSSEAPETVAAAPAAGAGAGAGAAAPRATTILRVHVSLAVLLGGVGGGGMRREGARVGGGVFLIGGWFAMTPLMTTCRCAPMRVLSRDAPPAVFWLSTSRWSLLYLILCSVDPFLARAWSVCGLCGAVGVEVDMLFMADLPTAPPPPSPNHTYTRLLVLDHPRSPL
jgi:hypothetical protein